MENMKYKSCFKMMFLSSVLLRENKGNTNVRFGNERPVNACLSLD